MFSWLIWLDNLNVQSKSLQKFDNSLAISQLILPHDIVTDFVLAFQAARYNILCSYDFKRASQTWNVLWISQLRVKILIRLMLANELLVNECIDITGCVMHTQCSPTHRWVSSQHTSPAAWFLLVKVAVFSLLIDTWKHLCLLSQLWWKLNWLELVLCDLLAHEKLFLIRSWIWLLSVTDSWEPLDAFRCLCVHLRDDWTSYFW